MAFYADTGIFGTIRRPPRQLTSCDNDSDVWVFFADTIRRRLAQNVLLRCRGYSQQKSPSQNGVVSFVPHLTAIIHWEGGQNCPLIEWRTPKERVGKCGRMSKENAGYDTSS
ncbi:hypothetical protein LOAG_04760 [Loa loa]|nr:hypothetical protein LOAG_04760 [Loa loa]EFO23729.1 hypothetical protein LOAG_04760 [Loa loa]